MYNAERYIEECIRSIIDGLSNEIEVLLIDDGSTDRSLEQIKNINKKMCISCGMGIMEFLIHEIVVYRRQRENILCLWMRMAD